MARSDVRVQLLGGFRVVVDGQPVDPEHWRRRKVRHLIQLVSLAGGHLHRDQLLDQLWPDLAPEAAANNLYQALHHARRALDPEGPTPSPFLQIRSDQVHLGPERAVRIDVADFDAAARVARGSPDPTAYRAALDRYAGDLLPDEPYEDWATVRREDLRRTYLGLLLQLARLQEERQEDEAAIATLRRILEADAVHEGATVALMRLHARRGERQQAVRQYQAFAARLRAELGAEPDPKIRRLQQAILDGRFPPPGRPAEPGAVPTPDREEGRRPAPAADPPPEARPAIPHNLPRQLTRFVGREREVAQLRQLVDGARLITLTGPGGCGKTRLALEVGGGSLATQPDGAWLIDLAPLVDPELVPRAVTTVLGIRESADQPVVTALVEALRDRSLLLILDNCEHLLDACARLADALLRGCPRVRVLATSREGLGLPGELLWPVPSLALPPADAVSVDQVGPCAAARLFVERAADVRPGFAITAANARVIAQVCHRLDGIPLALELAAARLQALSVEQLAARLDQRFRLLTGGSRAALARQQTLAATVGWSYDLLTPPDQTLFNRLAVFAGTFVIESAEAVCGDGGDVLDGLLRLVGKSLVVAESDDGGDDRYRLLETLRQYAREKLVAAGEAEAVAARHAGYYLALAERAEAELHGPEQAAWLDRLEGEHNNLRAAVDWLAGKGRWVEALRLAGAVSWFWVVRGHYPEGRARLDALLDRAGPDASAVSRARACAGLAYLVLRQGELSQARRHAEDAYQAARAAGDSHWVARASLALAWAALLSSEPANVDVAGAVGLAREAGDAWALGPALWYLWWRNGPPDLGGAEAMLAEGLALSRQAGDDWIAIWWARVEGAIARMRADYPRARATAEELGRIARRLGDRSSQGNALLDRGLAALAEGDVAIARPSFREARAIYRDVADRAGVAMADLGLGETSLLQKDLATGRDVAAEALELARELRDPSVIGWALRVNAEVGLASDDPVAARAQLAEAILLYRERFPDALPPLLETPLPLLLETVARAAVAEGAPARALRLATAALAERAKLGLVMRPIDEARLASALRQVERLLPDAERSLARADGLAMTREQAAAEALRP